MNKFMFLFMNILVISNKINCYKSHQQYKRTVSNPLWNETSIDKLRSDLLINYDKYAKSDEYYNTTEITFGLTILYLDTDELNSTFSTSMWISLSWKDAKLKWEPRNYNGIESLKMADHEIWQPDIYLFNSATSGGESIIRYGNPNALVYSDGSIVWILPIKFAALCEFDMYYWPFDRQYCYLRFGSATRSSKDIQLKLKDIEFEDPINTSKWKVTCAGGVIPVHVPRYLEFFHHAVFQIVLTRKPSSISTVVSASIFVSVCLVLMQRFFLFKNGKALITPCITAIVLCVFLMYYGSKVAPSASRAPWIVSFLSMCLFLNTFTLMESIFVVYIFKFKNKKNVYWKVKHSLNGRLGKILFLGDCIVQCDACSKSDVYGNEKILQRQEEDEVRKTKDCAITHEWELFIIATDRILFTVYSIIIAIFLLAYVI